MPRKLSPEALHKRLLELRERNIELMGEYTKAEAKHDFKCLKCGHIWRTAFSSVYNMRSGCPRCGCYAINIDQRLRELIDRGIELIDPYQNSQTKVRFRCLECRHVWSTVFLNVYNLQTGCPECAYKKLHKEPEVLASREAHYKQELLNSCIELLDSYINNKTRYNFRCLVCGYKFQRAFQYVYCRARHCPRLKYH